MKVQIECYECGLIMGPVNMSRHYAARHPEVIYPATAMYNQRFLFWVRKGSDADCWLWTGALDQDGYGFLNISEKSVRAHRWSYELNVGPIPDGLVIDHLCRVRHCVNPAHLEPVTNGENVMRGEGLAPTLARVTHCPQGHEYNEENTYVKPGGRNHRACRVCMNARSAEWNRSRDKDAFNAYRRERRARKNAEEAAEKPPGWQPPDIAGALGLDQ